MIKTEGKKFPFFSYDLAKWLPVFSEKEKQCQKVFQLSAESEGKKGCHVQKMFPKETEQHFYVVTVFGDRIDHTHTRALTQTIFHSELKHTRFSPNKIENENKLFSVCSSLFHFSVFDIVFLLLLLSNACINMFRLCHIAVSNWKSEARERLWEEKTSSSVWKIEEWQKQGDEEKDIWNVYAFTQNKLFKSNRKIYDAMVEENLGLVTR